MKGQQQQGQRAQGDSAKQAKEGVEVEVCNGFIEKRKLVSVIRNVQILVRGRRSRREKFLQYLPP